MDIWSASIGPSEMTRKKEADMLISLAKSRVQGCMCRPNCQSVPWQTPVSLKHALVVYKNTTLTEAHFLKAASKHFCGWETLRDRHLNCLCRQTLVLKCPKNRTERESDFNSIFHNSAKPKHIVKMSWIPRLWYIVVVKNCWVYYL